MRVILLCSKNANQRALANKIAENFNLVGIVIEEKKNSLQKKPLHLLNILIDKIFFSKINNAWYALMKYYSEKFPTWPNSKTNVVENINDKKTIHFLTSLEYDIIMVSGTRIIKDCFLDKVKPKNGIINLHTGISPYVKGGPNCTNWCLSEGNYHLIGNTIMWINKGIDSGNIIATETTTLLGDENLITIHKKVMEHAHDLYLRSLKAIVLNKEISSVKQNEIAKGVLYFNKDWNFFNKIRLLKKLSDFKHSYNSPLFKEKQQNLKLVRLRKC